MQGRESRPDSGRMKPLASQAPCKKWWPGRVLPPRLPLIKRRLWMLSYMAMIQAEGFAPSSAVRPPVLQTGAMLLCHTWTKDSSGRALRRLANGQGPWTRLPKPMRVRFPRRRQNGASSGSLTHLGLLGRQVPKCWAIDAKIGPEGDRTLRTDLAGICRR